MPFGLESRARKAKKLPRPGAVQPCSVAQTMPGPQSAVEVQQQNGHPSPPSQQFAYSVSPPSSSGYTPPPQQHHPIYGPTPQVLQQTGQPYATSPPPQQPSAQFSLDPATPPQNHGLVKTQWNRAERLASTSYRDLSAQFTSSANKSVDLANRSVAATMSTFVEKPTVLVTQKSVQMLNQSAALCDRLNTKLDAVITSMDEGLFSGKEQDLMVEEDQPSSTSASTLAPEMAYNRSAAAIYASQKNAKSSNMFSKVWLYSNSRLPPHLPPFKVYMPTYPLLCLAARYSERVYTPTAHPSTETETHVPADWRSGTKAMILTSLPRDDMNTVVFAIRGSQTFMDWAVNYRCEPSSPEGFLDDAGNACHAGFLYVAKKMVKPVAERLRVLLQENPARSNASLLITGHSAGGAVAALLYSHMMNTEIQSELSYLTGFFKRVHCITFGAPPISLLPLQKPNDQRHKKSIFFSFINEGDPVPRADRPVVKSLLKLYSSPAPSISSVSNLSNNFSKLNVSATSQPASTKQLRKFAKQKPSKSSLQTVSTLVSTTSRAPSWPIPTCALSPAGRLIILRTKGGNSSHMPGSGDEDVEAVTVDDQMLRSVVYGDPVKHMMRVYKKRVESLATKAVTGIAY